MGAVGGVPCHQPFVPVHTEGKEVVDAHVCPPDVGEAAHVLGTDRNLCAVEVAEIVAVERILHGRERSGVDSNGYPAGQYCTGRCSEWLLEVLSQFQPALKLVHQVDSAVAP